MVDIHSHILAGLDDGPADFSDSVAMVAMAADAGTTDIVATPHADRRFAFDPDVVRSRIAELQRAAPERIRIHYGCDFHLDFDNIARLLERPADYCIAGLKFLLVEFPDAGIPANVETIFGRMQQAGVWPIITHPERNPILRQSLDRLERWVEAGCYLQVTGQAFTGWFGGSAERAAHELVTRGLAHFVASDGHDRERRPPALAASRAHIEKTFGGAAAEKLLVTNPGAVLRGGEVEPVAPARRRRRWRWF